MSSGEMKCTKCKESKPVSIIPANRVGVVQDLPDEAVLPDTASAKQLVRLLLGSINSPLNIHTWGVLHTGPPQVNRKTPLSLLANRAQEVGPVASLTVRKKEQKKRQERKKERKTKQERVSLYFIQVK